MPRIRYLKPEFFSDEDLAELPFSTRITFAGLWCFADKAGRLEDRPKFLKAMIFPYDNINIEKELTKLCAPKRNGKPFIQRYQENGSNFIQVVNWEKHQKPHHTESESKFPPAPPLMGMEKGMGMGSVHNPSAPLSNGEVTVKERLRPVSIKNNYGSFNNVKLTEDQLQKLTKQFGKSEAEDKIESLSVYLASKGDKYKDHYATILSWDRKDKKKGENTDEDSVLRKWREDLDERIRQGKAKPGVS